MEGTPETLPAPALAAVSPPCHRPGRSLRLGHIPGSLLPAPPLAALPGVPVPHQSRLCPPLGRVSPACSPVLRSWHGATVQGRLCGLVPHEGSGCSSGRLDLRGAGSWTGTERVRGHLGADPRGPETACNVGGC